MTQALKDIVSPTIGHYNQQIVWQLDSTTLQPVGWKHEISYPPTVEPKDIKS